MARKFEVTFASATQLSPSVVYVSASGAYPGQFSVGILHPIARSGSFQTSGAIARTFDLKQNLVSSEDEALTWATTWLSGESGCNASLTEVPVA